MQSTSYVRNRQAVLDDLVLGEDSRMITKQGCKIHIPTRYVEYKLAQIGLTNLILGIHAIIVGNQYAVRIVDAMMRIRPTTTTKIKVDDEDYYEFDFPPGSVVYESTDLVKTPTLVYFIQTPFFTRGKTPWFMNYLDRAEIFSTAQKHAGAAIGLNREIPEFLVSLTSRDAQDQSVEYRHAIKSIDDVYRRPAMTVPVRNVSTSASGTFSKLGGAYMRQGVVSALVKPSERSSDIETILRQ